MGFGLRGGKNKDKARIDRAIIFRKGKTTKYNDRQAAQPAAVSLPEEASDALTQGDIFVLKGEGLLGIYPPFPGFSFNKSCIHSFIVVIRNVREAPDMRVKRRGQEETASVDDDDDDEQTEVHLS